MELVRINSFNLNMNDLPNSTKFTEGSTELVVPSNSISDPIPPKSPAFFNPLAKNSRDLSIIICKLESTLNRDGLTVGDVFAGVGARGIRIGNEVKGINSVLIIDLIILYVDMRITAILIAVILLLDVLKNNLWYL